MSNPKEIENLETVIERHEKSNKKLEIDKINKIKEVKELETTKKELKELVIEKTNEAIFRKETILPYFLRYVWQLMNQAKDKKVSEKCIRITEILKDVMIKSNRWKSIIKEIDEKVDSYKKQDQLELNNIKLIN